MSTPRNTKRAYSRAEYLSDAAIHVLGLAAALAAVPILITLTISWRGDSSAIFAVSVYGATLIAMILFSALHNLNRDRRWRWLLRRLDHSAIYLKIAGTYTPFALLSGGYAAPILAGLWAAALCGFGMKLYSPSRFRWFALALYLGMGWVAVLIGWDLFAAMSPPVLALVVTGGLLYTVGVTFYLFESLAFHNTIWHVFVLTATVAFFTAITLHMADTATTVMAAQAG